MLYMFILEEWTFRLYNNAYQCGHRIFHGYLYRWFDIHCTFLPMSMIVLFSCRDYNNSSHACWRSPRIHKTPWNSSISRNDTLIFATVSHAKEVVAYVGGYILTLWWNKVTMGDFLFRSDRLLGAWVSTVGDSLLNTSSTSLSWKFLSV